MLHALYIMVYDMEVALAQICLVTVGYYNYPTLNLTVLCIIWSHREIIPLIFSPCINLK